MIYTRIIIERSFYNLRPLRERLREDGRWKEKLLSLTDIFITDEKFLLFQFI